MTLRKTPTKSVQLVHTSDLHIYSPESCTTLLRIVESANHANADLLVVSGDLFDNSRVTQETVEKTVEALSHLNMPAVLLPGNHDQLDDHSVYHRVNLSFAPLVHLISNPDGQQVGFPDLDLVVWGRAMEEHSPKFRPLEGAPSRDGFGWYVGMAHGFHYPTGEKPDRSSPIFAEEIAKTSYDYMALGHVHVYRNVSSGPVSAFYSGAPDDHAIAHTGQVALVTLDPESGVRVEQIPLANLPDHH